MNLNNDNPDQQQTPGLGQPASAPTPALDQQPAPAPAPAPLPPYSQPIHSTPKKRSQKLLIMLAFGIIAIAAIAFLLMTVFAKPTPEAQLTRALTSSLSTKTIRQEYRISQDGNTFDYDADTDFTDPSKSALRGLLTIKTLEGKAEFDTIALPNTTYILIKKNATGAFTEASPLDGLIDKWYDASDDESFLTPTLSISMIAEGIRTPLGEVITGNFSEEMRSEILKRIKDNKIYIVKEHTEVTDGGRKLLKLKVAIDAKAVTDLNKWVADELKIELIEGFESVADGTLYIDTKLKRIVKVEAVQDGADITIDYSRFDDKLDIDKPSSVLSKSKLNDILRQ